MNSFNHYSFGSVGAVAVRARRPASRLDPERPGYEHVLIAPEPGGLAWARATYHSVSGPISSGWRQEDGTFQLDVEIPANVTATVVLPGGETARGRLRAPELHHARASERELVRARPGAEL